MDVQGINPGERFRFFGAGLIAVSCALRVAFRIADIEVSGRQELKMKYTGPVGRYVERMCNMHLACTFYAYNVCTACLRCEMYIRL